MFLATTEKLAIRNALIDRLREVPIGQTVANAEIQALSKGHEHCFRAAMRSLERSHGILFENVRGVGYKRLETVRLPSVGERARKAIARRAGMAKRRIINGSRFANDLDRHTQMRITQELGVLGVLQEMAKDGA